MEPLKRIVGFFRKTKKSKPQEEKTEQPSVVANTIKETVLSASPTNRRPMIIAKPGSKISRNFTNTRGFNPQSHHEKALWKNNGPIEED